jgi:hypothetical protein
MIKILAMSLLFIGAAVLEVIAQDENGINPDRPGLGTGTYTMAPKRYQAEYGYQRSIGRGDPSLSASVYPELLVRTGLTSNIEVSLYWQGWELVGGDDLQTLRSTSGLTIGGKFGFLESDRFNLTAQMYMITPIASGSSTKAVYPTIGLLWDYQGGGAISWSGAFHIASEDAGTNREIVGQITFGASIAVTNRLGFYTEYVGSAAFIPNADFYQPINTGFTLLVTPKLQFDIYAGIGLNQKTDHVVGSGFAILF